MSYTVNPNPALHKVIATIARKTEMTMGEVTVGLAGMAIAQDETLHRLANEITADEQHAAAVLRSSVLA